VRLTFLGTGTSFGSPRDRMSTCRTLHFNRSEGVAALATARFSPCSAGNLLVDAPPSSGSSWCERESSGIDCRLAHATSTPTTSTAPYDLRIFRFEGEGGHARVLARPVQSSSSLRRFPYIFDEAIQPPVGSTIPQFRLRGFQAFEEVEILGTRFLPVPVPHGSTTVFGFRAGALGYVTDGKCLPPRTVDALQGVKVLVLNALWWGRPHPTHFNVEEALAAAQEVGAERTFLIHMTHEVRHQELLDRLPAGVEPAYDGLSVEIPDE